MSQNPIVWISVDDALPILATPVIVILRNGTQTIASIDVNNVWVDENSVPLIFTPILWRLIDEQFAPADEFSEFLLKNNYFGVGKHANPSCCCGMFFVVKLNRSTQKCELVINYFSEPNAFTSYEAALAKANILNKYCGS